MTADVSAAEKITIGKGALNLSAIAATATPAIL